VCLVAQAFAIFNVKGGGSPAWAGSSSVSGFVESRAGARRALGDASALPVMDDC
jgi:hypothetical protein